MEGRPGSPCQKHFLVSNTEFTEKPICLASRKYQAAKLKEIENAKIPADEKAKLIEKVVQKTCICQHLGNGALIALGLAEEQSAPQSICPGPNIEWFDRLYTLKEMVDHIYGRRPSLVSSKRPHMFAKEIVMYVDYFEKQIANSSYKPKEIETLLDFKKNLEEGLDFCLEIAQRPPYPGENLASLSSCVEEQRRRLASLYTCLKKNIPLVSDNESGLDNSTPKRAV
jgi:hypothetical protein